MSWLFVGYRGAILSLQNDHSLDWEIYGARPYIFPLVCVIVSRLRGELSWVVLKKMRSSFVNA